MKCPICNNNLVLAILKQFVGPKNVTAYSMVCEIGNDGIKCHYYDVSTLQYNNNCHFIYSFCIGNVVDSHYNYRIFYKDLIVSVYNDILSFRNRDDIYDFNMPDPLIEINFAVKRPRISKVPSFMDKYIKLMNLT